MKKIGILGSTGSVGKQAINVIENNLDKFEIVFLTAHSNFELLLEQAKKFNPDFICIDYKYKNNFESTKIYFIILLIQIIILFLEMIISHYFYQYYFDHILYSKLLLISLFISYPLLLIFSKIDEN